MRRRFRSPRFQLHRREAGLQEAQAEPGQVPGLVLGTSGRHARRSGARVRLRGRGFRRLRFRGRLRGSLVRPLLAHGGGGRFHGCGSERKEAGFVLRPGGGGLPGDQVLGGEREFSNLERSGVTLRRTPPRRAGFRDQPHRSARGRGGTGQNSGNPRRRERRGERFFRKELV